MRLPSFLLPSTLAHTHNVIVKRSRVLGDRRLVPRRLADDGIARIPSDPGQVAVFAAVVRL